MSLYHGGQRPHEITQFYEAIHSLDIARCHSAMPPHELIIVDDGSPNPMTRAAIEYVAAGRDWIKVILNDQNRGPSSARNDALRIASYPYVTGFDCDDLVVPHYAAFLRDSIEMLKFDFGITSTIPAIQTFGAYERRTYIPPNPTVKQHLLYGYAPVCAVFRLVDVMNVGGYRENAYKAEDWMLMVDVMVHRMRRGVNNQSLTDRRVSYLYRQHHDSLSVNKRPWSKQERFSSIINDAEDIFERYCGTADVDQLVKRTSRLSRIFKDHIPTTLAYPLEVMRLHGSRVPALNRIFNKNSGVCASPELYARDEFPRVSALASLHHP